ncbi:uncharacterized protein NPIL_416991 [Nephila pilipes]|uniref:Uncharacterized protein n=1 Tax=Nephila pilipes TaxID=299642 RepID=A0A8X6R1Z0_NEPPI|nr:uncharacterized protein NPIL_416991 [Nephila pilipes]
MKESWPTDREKVCSNSITKESEAIISGPLQTVERADKFILSLQHWVSGTTLFSSSKLTDRRIFLERGIYTQNRMVPSHLYLARYLSTSLTMRNMICLLILISLAKGLSADPFSFGIAKSLPPFGIPVVDPEVEKEIEIEEIAKKLSLDKSWPFVEKDIIFDKGIDLGIGIGKELEFEKEFDLSKIAELEKTASIEKSFPWWLYEKYFGVAKKLTFEQALAFELYKKYGYYGIWVVRELHRRFQIAKRLGLIGKDIEFQEAISLGLFKGIGLEKIFESEFSRRTFEYNRIYVKAFRERNRRMMENYL